MNYFLRGKIQKREKGKKLGKKKNLVFLPREFYKIFFFLGGVKREYIENKIGVLKQAYILP